MIIASNFLNAKIFNKYEKYKQNKKKCCDVNQIIATFLSKLI